MACKRERVDEAHISLAMLAAFQTGLPYDELVYYPDEQLLAMIEVPEYSDPLDPPDGLDGLLHDGKLAPHRRGTRSSGWRH